MYPFSSVQLPISDGSLLAKYCTNNSLTVRVTISLYQELLSLHEPSKYHLPLLDNDPPASDLSSTSPAEATPTPPSQIPFELDFSPSQFTPFISTADQTKIRGISYLTINANDVSLIDTARFQTAPPTPSKLAIHVSKNLFSRDIKKLETMPAKSVYAFLVDFLDGRLIIPQTASTEHLVLLFHLAYLRSHFGLGCKNSLHTLCNSLFRLPRSSIDFSLLLQVAWSDCCQHSLLLALLSLCLRTHDVNLEIIACPVLSLSHLNPTLFISFLAALAKKKSIFHMLVGSDAWIQNIVSQHIATDPQELVYLNTSSSVIVSTIPEVLYARWPQFRKSFLALGEGERTISLPFSQEVTTAICLSFISNLWTRPIPLQEASFVLTSHNIATLAPSPKIISLEFSNLLINSIGFRAATQPSRSLLAASKMLHLRLMRLRRPRICLPS